MYPAVMMALKQDFWSIRDQMTYFASGRLALKGESSFMNNKIW